MRRCLSAVFTVALLVLTAAPTAAASPKVSGNTVLVYRNSDGTSVVLTVKANTPKEAQAQSYSDAVAAGWIGATGRSAALQTEALAAATMTCSRFYAGSSYTCTLSRTINRYFTPPGGTYDRLQTSFSSSIKLVGNSMLGTCSDVYYVQSHSSTLWWGTNPWNANEVTLSDVWSATGWAFTGVTISVPPGAGFSPSGNVLTWNSPSLYNSDRMDHYTWGVRFSGSMLNGTDETAIGSMRFGTAWYTAITSGGMH